MSLEAQKAMFAQETGAYPILLFSFEHSTLTEPIRISTDPTTQLSLTTDVELVKGTVHLGHEYIYCPMDIQLPDENEGSRGGLKLTISNIGRELVRHVRSITSSPDVSMRLVLSSNVDQIEAELTDMCFMGDIEIDAMSVTGTLQYDQLHNEPTPYMTFTPATAPGLFK